MNAKRIVSRVVIVAAGAVAAAVVWGIALITGGIQLTTNGTVTDMPLWQVLAAAVVVGLAGWGLLAVLEWRLPRARKAWTTAAAIVAVLSLAGPLAVPGIEAGDRVWLLVMHVALALAYIPAMARTASGRAVPGGGSESADPRR